jgi:TonB family protein
VEAVGKWHFHPGLRHGQAVAARIRKEVFIDPASENAARTRMTNIRPKKDDSATPSAFLIGDHTVYPLAALQSGQEGRVVVQYMVGYGGRARQLAVKESSSPEFSLAALAALESVYFVETDEAKPILVFQSGTITFTFKSDGTGNVAIRESARRILRRLADHSQTIVSPSALDAPLKLTHPVSPTRPNAFSGGKPPIGPLDLSQPSILAAMTPRPHDKKTGETLVEFFVDEDGCVQLPRVVSATEPEFGTAAAQAVSEWRFAPPTQAGKPVVVRAQVPVKFGPR